MEEKEKVGGGSKRGPAGSGGEDGGGDKRGQMANEFILLLELVAKRLESLLQLNIQQINIYPPLEILLLEVCPPSSTSISLQHHTHLTLIRIEQR